MEKGNIVRVGNFSSRLREIRKIRELTQLQLAEIMAGDPENVDDDTWQRNISSNLKSISNWERRKSTPNVDALLQLCVILNCEADYLIGLAPNPHHQVTDIMAETGMTKSVVDKLRYLNSLSSRESDDTYKEWITYLNAVLDEGTIVAAINNLKTLRDKIRKVPTVIKDRLNDPFVLRGDVSKETYLRFIIDDIDKDIDFAFFNASRNFEEIIRQVTGYIPDYVFSEIKRQTSDKECGFYAAESNT